MTEATPLSPTPPSPAPPSPAPPSPEVLAELAGFDTPTICNALDLLRPGRAGVRWTQSRLLWARAEEPAMVGFAITATVRGASPPPFGAEEAMRRRLAYWQYLKDAPRPTILLAQDLDPAPGAGGIWGDVNAAIHQGFGCRGVVTNGAVRDLPLLPAGFAILAGTVTPSHGHGHVAGWNEPVTVAGMAVAPGELVHADRHGAVTIPPELAPRLAEAARRVQRREAHILAAARAPGLTPERLAAAFREVAGL